LNVNESEKKVPLATPARKVSEKKVPLATSAGKVK
jgi:hypothetical protein